MSPPLSPSMPPASCPNAPQAGSERVSSTVYELAGILLIWMLGLTFQLTVVPKFSDDEVYFKSAAFHLQKEGRFAAPEEQGFRPTSNWQGAAPETVQQLYALPVPETGMDQVFASYPPGYPFLFLIWIKLFGFGWKQAVIFDRVIELALALLVWRLVKLKLPRSHGWFSFGAAAVIFALGHSGRPDEVAMVFAAGAMYVLMSCYASSPRTSALVSGLLLGACGPPAIPAPLWRSWP